ncbi:MAG: hypothetical protein F2686_03915 [Actinobacteria bacterium]|nr:hypothetical protein [Actinomycetota bacterium]MSY44757.1 hypothetical protein [Actinomycetota bacterium]
MAWRWWQGRRVVCRSPRHRHRRRRSRCRRVLACSRPSIRP